MISAYEDVALWHERDISHSAVERVILPDATTILDYALDRFTRLLKNLVVFDDHMRENLEKTFGLYNSQRLLTLLIDSGLAREDAYDMVQPLAMTAWNERRAFKEIVLGSSEIASHLTADQVEDAFDPHYHTRHVGDIFRRVGLS
jgi:adenylosuccinate lyase